MTDYQQVINRIYDEVKPMWPQAAPADYIPALAAADASQFGIAVHTLAGQSFSVGATDIPFSIQSISKVFTFAMVARHMGDTIWESVGREPSGTPFNSLVQLEYEQGRPRNPFINAGALVVTDRLIDLYPRPKEAILDFVRSLAGNPDIYYDHHIARSERETASRNMALAYLMKSFGNIHNDVDTLIDVYCSQCAISMTCADLARSFLFLANRGVNPLAAGGQERILTPSRAKRLGAVMLTCGFYDESGDFAFRVGLPGKSGVGGGIAAYIPGQLSIAVWCPGLNSFGNSLLGIETLERFTTDIGVSIF
ncbi:MAG: glutaminase [Pseudoflavonifractor sp.]|nr:glutaminase [Alloprevotella sp.]MCM1117079.1 glutaminase [Pseudoflavonifractor sp.]